MYIIATRCTDPKTIAHDLKLKTVASASSALEFWHGVGLLEKEQSGPSAPPPVEKAPPLTADQLRMAALRDPTVSMLASEAQTCLGKALGQKDIQRVVSLYVNESIPAEMCIRDSDEPLGQHRDAQPFDHGVHQRRGGHGLPGGRDRKARLLDGAVDVYKRQPLCLPRCCRC